MSYTHYGLCNSRKHCWVVASGRVCHGRAWAGLVALSRVALAAVTGLDGPTSGFFFLEWINHKVFFPDCGALRLPGCPGGLRGLRLCRASVPVVRPRPQHTHQRLMSALAHKSYVSPWAHCSTNIIIIINKRTK